jgi:pSer/pThr/pTyr-binding forkhead associated (FHA) protein
VTSVGRHNDCLIRIKSAQVSRRHCELFELDGKLHIRDLGSSNGTFVNGKRVTGQHALKPGDELTVGAVTLRVATLGQPGPAQLEPRPKAKAGDTAVVDAVPVGADDEEFEMEFDEDESELALDVIPLAEEEVSKPAETRPGPKAAAAPAKPAEAKETPPPKGEKEDEAITQFLLDLKLDEDE